MKIVNVHLLDNKALFVGLQRIKGIGKTTALKVCEDLKMDPNQKVGQLTREDEDKLNSHIETNYKVEDSLKQLVATNIAQKISSRTYAGSRLSKGLPLKQRTKSNAQTSRKLGRKIG